MATQTVEFRAPPSQTITAKLFAIGSDTEVASASATEATNRKGTYAVPYEDEPAGEYELIALVGSVPVARWFVTLTLTTATFQAYDKVSAALDSAALLEALGLDDGNLDAQLQAILEAAEGGDCGDCGDATEAKQDQILLQIQTALIAASAAVIDAVGGIEGFPAWLRIGDSYVDSLGTFIKVFIRDPSNTPLTGVGTKLFADEDFTADLTISQGARSSLVTAVCEWVPADGPLEGYLKVQIPSDQSRRATEGHATMQLVLRWGNGAEWTAATQAVEWRQRVTRSLQ